MSSTRVALSTLSSPEYLSTQALRPQADLRTVSRLSRMMSRLSRLSRTSWARAAPLAQAFCSRGAFKSPGLALAARSTSALLQMRTTPFEAETRAMAPMVPSLRLILAGAAFSAFLSSEADCVAGKRQKTSKARPAAAAAKTCGPALSAIEKALEPADKTFNVEKILATRLSTGVKQYLILGAEGEGADKRGSLGA